METDTTHLIGSQLGRACLFASWPTFALFGEHISDVLLLSPDAKMAGIDAKWVVAGMHQDFAGRNCRIGLLLAADYTDFTDFFIHHK